MMADVVDTSWTPGRGLLRAIVVAIVLTVLLSVALGALAVAAPLVLMNAFGRAFITLAVGCMMFGAVHAAAGMVGGVLTWIATIASAVVMFSNHVAWAIYGAHVGRMGELLIGWDYWFDPARLAILGISVIAPLALCVPLCRSGVPGPDFFAYIAKIRIWGSR